MYDILVAKDYNEIAATVQFKISNADVRKLIEKIQEHFNNLTFEEIERSSRIKTRAVRGHESKVFS